MNPTTHTMRYYRIYRHAGFSAVESMRKAQAHLETFRHGKGYHAPLPSVVLPV
jgi:hypothetical protein